MLHGSEARPGAGAWPDLWATAGRRRGSLAEGHCCIVPAEHVASARRCEDGVVTEMRNFKKSLLQMFMARVRCRPAAPSVTHRLEFTLSLHINMM